MVLPNCGIPYIPTSIPTTTTPTTWHSLIPYSSSTDWLRLQNLSSSLYIQAKHVVEHKMDPFFNTCVARIDDLMRDHPDPLRHTSCITHVAHEYGYALQSLLSRYIDVAETAHISDTSDEMTNAADTLINVSTTRVLRSQVRIKDDKTEIKVKKECEKVKTGKRKQKIETKKSTKRVKIEQKIETDTTDSDTDDGVDWSSMGTGSHNSILKAWLKSHWNDPYPTAAEKRQLVKATGRTYDQVQHWFINARMRIWRPALRRSRADPDLLTKPFPQPLMVAAVKMKQEQQQANYMHGNKMMVTFPPLEGDGEMEIQHTHSHQYHIDGNEAEIDAHAAKATRASIRIRKFKSTSTSASTKRKDSTSSSSPQSTASISKHRIRIPRRSVPFPRISVSPPTFVPPPPITPTTITPSTSTSTTASSSSNMYLPIPINMHMCPNSPSNKLTKLDTADASKLSFATSPSSPQIMSNMCTSPSKLLCVDPSTSAFTFISPPSSPLHLLTAFPLPLPLPEPDLHMDAGDSPTSSTTSRSSMCSDATALCLSPTNVYTSASPMPMPMSLW